MGPRFPLVPTVLRGNAVFDALCHLRFWQWRSPEDAERPRRHSHAERGNEKTRFTAICSKIYVKTAVVISEKSPRFSLFRLGADTAPHFYLQDHPCPSRRCLSSSARPRRRKK